MMIRPASAPNPVRERHKTMATNFSNRRSRKLSIQPLEQRTLMAGDVGAVLNNSVLTLTGDALDNDISVAQQMTNNVPVAGSFTLIGHPDANGVPTTINGRQSVSFTGVNAINASLGNGNDHLTLGSKKFDGSLTPFNLDSNLTIDMGDGENTVDLLATTTIRGEATISSGDLADNFNISGNFQRSLSINGNGGFDFVQVNKATVTNDLNINAGTDDHFDWVNVYNTK